MTRTLESGKLTVSLTATVKNAMTFDTTKSASGAIAFSESLQLTSGINASQGNRGVEYAGTILSGASLVIDLYDFAGIDLGAGDGKDITGQELLLEEIVAIAILNDNAVGVDGQLEIEPDGTNGWTPIGTHTAATGGALRGQGILFKSQPAEAGFDITDTSSHRLKLTANGGDISFRFALIARSDDDDSSSSSSSQSSSSSSSSSSSDSSSSQSSSSSDSSSSLSSSSSSQSSSSSDSSSSSSSSSSSQSV